MALYVYLIACLKIVHCNEDIYAKKIEGTRENSILYVIGDNLYSKERIHKDQIITRCVHWKIAKKHCKARANIVEESLLVISQTGDHTCDQDPLQRTQIMMESKMKMLAATSGDSIRKIFDDVSLENPEVAAKIPYPRMEVIMRHRRQKTTPINATTFA